MTYVMANIPKHKMIKISSSNSMNSFQSVDSSNSEIVSIAGKRVVVVKLRDELESGTENCPENKETNDVKAKKCAKANPVAKNGEARLLSLTKDGLITLNVISKAPTANPRLVFFF